MAFHKYPRTPHLGSLSEIVDDDRSVEGSAFFGAYLGSSEHTLVVQEKVDGANVGIHFEAEWPPIMQKRSAVLGQGEKRQYDVFRDWVYEKASELYEVLGTEYVLFGEWLWEQHGVHYSHLPEYFLAFDILHKESGRFLSYPEVQQRLADVDIHQVPLLYSASFSDLQEISGIEKHILSLVTNSQYGIEVAEGVYVRIDGTQYVEDRAKYRRPTFTSGRDGFGKEKLTNELAPQ